MPEAKCLRRNSLGECLEYVKVDDRVIVKFDKKADCPANKDLVEEWKRLTREKKILIMPGD